MQSKIKLGILVIIFLHSMLSRTACLALVILKTLNNISLESYKKYKEESKEEMKDKEHINNSFELIGFLNWEFCKGEMNYLRSPCLSFLL